MKATLPLLNKPETETINHRIYDRDSYISAIKKYFKIWDDSGSHPYLYRFDVLAYLPGQTRINNFTGDPHLIIGKVLSFDENNFSVEVDISEQYAEEFKDLSSYYIQLRVFGYLDESQDINSWHITGVVLMELNNDQANIAKKESNVID